MKRKIRLEASFSGVLPTGSYANMRPSFLASMEYEQDFQTDEEMNLAIETGQQELQSICYQNFESEAQKAKILKIKEDLKNFRFYPSPLGDENWPSLTSFLFYDKDFINVTDDELRQFAAQGNIYDWEIKNFIRTGKWVDSKDAIELVADRHIIRNGSKQLSLESCKFREFIEKFPINELRVHDEPLFNKELKYGCTPDLEGVYNGLPTMIEIKRTKDLADNFKQLAGQAKCLPHIKQLMVIEFKSEEDGGNKQGFSKPSTTLEMDRYYELVKYKRNEFTKIYGI